MNYLDNPHINNILETGEALLKVKYYSELTGIIFAALIIISIAIVLFIIACDFVYIWIRNRINAERKRKEELLRKKAIEIRKKQEAKAIEIKRTQKAKVDKEIIDLNKKIETLLKSYDKQEVKNDQ